MLIYLPAEARNRHSVPIIKAFGFEKAHSALNLRRVWAVPSDGVDYREYDYSQADVICFGPDKGDVEQYVQPGDDRITITGLPWPIFVDQAMAIIMEHVRNTYDLDTE